MITDFYGKKVAILGLSTEGTDATRFFANEGAKVHCCDRRSAQELGDIYATLRQLPVTFHLGNQYLSKLENYDLLIRTPGMAAFLPELIAAKKQGKKISSLTQVFFDLCKAPIIGVTGTKGKGTTTTLIGEILKASGSKTYVGGNVGVPLLSQVRQIRPQDWVVLELSSFQLEDLTKSPHISVILNITSDHLANADPLSTNYHPTHEDYIQAKRRIIQFQAESDYCVYNYDYQVSRKFGEITLGQKFAFSTREKIKGAYVENERLVLSHRDKVETFADTHTLQLRGRHNWENILAAALAASLAGASLFQIKRVVPQFRGLEHRLEFVLEKNGIKYYNDSFSTTPETAIAAINSFSEPIILIAGGSEKGSDFTELGYEIIKNHVKAVILIGDMAERIETAIQSAANEYNKPWPKMIKGLTQMQDMVVVARKIAASGDVVVLSPACASFGLFKNYKERGNLFKTYVKA